MSPTLIPTHHPHPRRMSLHPPDKSHSLPPLPPHTLILEKQSIYPTRISRQTQHSSAIQAHSQTPAQPPHLCTLANSHIEIEAGTHNADASSQGDFPSAEHMSYACGDYSIYIISATNHQAKSRLDKKTKGRWEMHPPMKRPITLLIRPRIRPDLEILFSSARTYSA